MASFLSESKPGEVSHSMLSASFLTKPSYMDAIVFLAGTAAPSATNMTTATRRFGLSQSPHESAFNLALDDRTTFVSTLEMRSKLQRQWSAYSRHVMGEIEAVAKNALNCFDWSSLGASTVVEVSQYATYSFALQMFPVLVSYDQQVGAQSPATAVALAEVYPALRLVVQLQETAPPETYNFDTAVTPEAERWDVIAKSTEVPAPLRPRITLQKRFLTATQTVEGAAVYILHLPKLQPYQSISALPPHIKGYLLAHLGVLRASPTSRIILLIRPFAEHDADPDIATMARLRDLSLSQLTNEYEVDMWEVVDMLATICDAIGRFVLVNKLRAHNGATVAFEIQYKAYDDLQYL